MVRRARVLNTKTKVKVKRRERDRHQLGEKGDSTRDNLLGPTPDEAIFKGGRGRQSLHCCGRLEKGLLVVGARHIRYDEAMPTHLSEDDTTGRAGFVKLRRHGRAAASPRDDGSAMNSLLDCVCVGYFAASLAHDHALLQAGSVLELCGSGLSDFKTTRPRARA